MDTAANNGSRPRALLTDAYRERPYWWDRARPPVVPELDLPRELDAVVVGGGYTGLGAAIELADLGRSVLVLEKNELGFGASTRNGGMIHPGVNLELEQLFRKHGPLGRRIYDFTVEAFMAAEKMFEDRVACDYDRSGHLYLAAHPSHVSSMRALEHLYRERLGQPATFLSREDLPKEVGSQRFHGGVLIELSGGLDPAKYHAGLAALAIRSGVAIAEDTPALSLRAMPRGGFEVRTPRETVRARNVIVATNGYRDGLLPWLRRRVIPIGSYIIATEPLEPALASEVIPNRRMLFDSKNFLNYWRMSPDGRMLFGGRASFAPTTIEKARDTLYAQMVQVHPQLEGVRVERAWGGKVGFTLDRIPHAGVHEGVHFAAGYCGTGVALAHHLGRCVGAWVAGGSRPPIAEPSFPPLPAGRVTEHLLPFAGLYFQLRDRIG
ncbi:MAG: NAD(P)/FAD-dependent oxidoreductase [Actinomycetota bacterium]